ncbi:MAG: GAF domain-containing protein [Syntrophaceae bacterium]|jgi:HD-GYP domain-containing protein (c-di-GMP phosphodiesterase class II)|nr:GAF domain-containing protein [Syntrophaceae bacterium]HOC61206.1 GAF domain-containing protein [Smithellaceae bacterium]HQM46697.1 GAF domain-containing protein [Smithellaceae bacterium]
MEEMAVLQDRIHELTRQNERLKHILAMGDSFCRERHLEKLLPLMMKEISFLLDADRSSLFLIDWEHQQLWTKYAEGLESDRIQVGLKMGLVGQCVLTKKIVNVASAYDSRFFNSEIDVQTGFRTESVLCVPVFHRKQEVIGALQFLNKRSGVFTKQDEEKLTRFAEEVIVCDDAGKFDLSHIKTAVTSLRDEVNGERCTLFLLNQSKGELYSAFADDIEGWNISLSLNLGIAGLVALTAEAINIPDAYEDDRFDKRIDELTGYRTRCLLCAPLKTSTGDILGAIEVMNKNNGVFTQTDMEYLKFLASYLSIFLENAILFNEQTTQFRSVLEVLAASIDAKDSLTSGHSSRVAQYTLGIASELGYNEDDLDTLNVAALLHDYGKLGTDDRILKKPGRLTPEEFEHIKEHVVNTKNILSKMAFSRKYRAVPFLASQHHERLDGSGYMDSLSGTEIPFMARIIAVADVFEALTAKRHYRDALPVEEAFRMLEEDSGIKYDDNVISALKSYCKKQAIR